MTFPVTPASVLEVLLPVLVLLLTPIYVLRARAGRLPSFRDLPGIGLIRSRTGALTESGELLHVAAGANSGSADGVTPAAETIASVLIAQRVAQETTRRGGHVVATSGDLTSHLALRGAIHDAYRQSGFAADYRADGVQLVAQNTPTAYAAGVAARYRVEPVAAGVVAGAYGAESLLITEEGAANGVPQVAAAASLSALPGLALSADATMIGEDLFAAESYLTDDSSPKSRLLTHDALRWAIVALIAAAMIWQMLALLLPGLGLPALS
jgi:hypothetical protein